MPRAPNTEVEILPTPQAVAERAAEATVRAAREAIEARGRFTMALSGGTTPRLYHEVLAAKHAGAIDWSKVHLLFSDDRAVPASHKDSNYKMAEETLISRVPIPRAQVHRIDADDGDPVRAAGAYAKIYEEVAGNEMAIDLVLLGMGEDGHTASLFPGMKTEPGFVIPAEAPPTSPIARRVTFSYSAIARARRVIAMICGASKATRLREVLIEEGGLPMQRVVRERTGATLFIVDNAAAALLAGAQKN